MEFNTPQRLFLKAYAYTSLQTIRGWGKREEIIERVDELRNVSWPRILDKYWELCNKQKVDYRLVFMLKREPCALVFGEWRDQFVRFLLEMVNADYDEIAVLMKR